MPRSAPLQVLVTLLNGEQRQFEDVNYLSLVNGDTFGKPPIVSEQEGALVVLYVNTGGVACVEVEREA